MGKGMMLVLRVPRTKELNAVVCTPFSSLISTSLLFIEFILSSFSNEGEEQL
jgi:hypothetical protein